MADASKHQQLVSSLSEGVCAKLRPLIESMKTESAAEFANMHTLLAAVAARLEVLEAGGGAGGAAKRAPRGERKTGAAKAGGAKAAGAAKDTGDDLDKVKNSMLFCRRMWELDADFRAEYTTADVEAAIQADEKCTKHAEGSKERLLAEGSLVWRTCLTDAQKKEIKDKFVRWQEERAKGDLAPPLAADEGEETA